MVGLAAFGTMVSMISTGARIAGERQAGWTRQLRISPLSVGAYFRAKVLTGYGMALSSLLLLYASGAALGVSLTDQRWLGMTALILVGLLPLAALGILLGHLVTTDSAQQSAGEYRYSPSWAAPGSRSRTASCTRWDSSCLRGGSFRPAMSRSTAKDGAPAAGSRLLPGPRSSPPAPPGPTAGTRIVCS